MCRPKEMAGGLVKKLVDKRKASRAKGGQTRSGSLSGVVNNHRQTGGKGKGISGARSRRSAIRTATTSVLKSKDIALGGFEG